MAVVTNVARRFLVACAKAEDTKGYFAYGRISHLFKNAEKDDFAQFDDHVRKHGAMPSYNLLKGWWFDLPKADEPHSYYMEALRDRHMKSVLTAAVDEANELVQQDQSEQAAKTLLDKVMPELMRRYGNRLIDIGEAYDLVTTNYFQQMKAGDDYGLKIGYPVVDDYGGLIAGDVLSWVGRPASGKSWLQLRGAYKAWLQGHSPVFLSMEMSNLATGQRLVAMDAGLPINGVKLQKNSGLTTQQMAKLAKATEKAKSAARPFHLMDGNLSTTVEDIYSFCRQMKPTCLVIDGAYMLKHPNIRLGRYERVAENCELLKQEIAGNLGIPVIASWQFSREAAKKMNSSKKSEAVGLEDIGSTDVIGQISTIVLGLMQEETVETMHRKKVSILKGRNGETGSFDINWQFSPTLNFDVWVEPDVTELSWL